MSPEREPEALQPTVSHAEQMGAAVAGEVCRRLNPVFGRVENSTNGPSNV